MVSNFRQVFIVVVLFATPFWLGACKAVPTKIAALPVGFVYLHDVAPSIQEDIRYAGSNNFMGRPVVGYRAPRCILSRPAADALAAVQREIEPQGLAIKVYDCYRPQRAVNDFVAWSHDLADQKTKAEYYPHVAKSELFAQGYIAEKSGHSRGSTVDLGLVASRPVAGSAPGQTMLTADVNMGTAFDFFDESAHTEFVAVSPMAHNNRFYLRQLMQRHGFRNLPEEWWHFTLEQEPWPQTYFDFEVW